MRDRADNFVVICSIENFDPMGIHTGDSVTVAPAQTLTDREYQVMRNASRAIIREVGVETGGSNIQFAVDPKTGRHGRDRDEPARLALVRAGQQGHRLPDRQDRGAAGHRLPPGRDQERHHARDARLLRAGASTTWWSRSRAGPSRSSADASPRAGHADEVGGRGDGHRPHLQGGAAEGPARPGDRRQRLRAPTSTTRASRRSCSRPIPTASST